jgi:AAA15 family ATPase/GTPase
MLIQFKIANFKCFKDEAVLSMRAATHLKNDVGQHKFSPIVNKPDYQLLPSVAIYGANASGKSSIVQALSVMLQMVLHSANESNSTTELPSFAHRLHTISIQEPTLFEIIFLHHNIKYRYGFAIQKNPNAVVEEWLYTSDTTKQKQKEVEIFYRKEQDFDAHSSFKIGNTISKMVRPNALWLSVAAQLNDPIATNVQMWSKKCHTLSGMRTGYKQFTAEESQKNPIFKKQVLELMQAADLGILDFEVADIPDEEIANLPKVIRDLVADKKVQMGKSIKTHHQVYNEYNLPTDVAFFDMETDESDGTMKYFALAGPLLDALQSGDILVVDELESQLHPLLTQKIIDLFNKPQSNPNGAQLLFTTHNTYLLESMPRDQIWLTEKDNYGAATLVAVSDYQVRENENVQRNYLLGKYGAIPYLRPFETITTSPQKPQPTDV